MRGYRLRVRRLALILTLLVAGCGGDATTVALETVTVTVSGPVESARPYAVCEVEERGSDARVRFRGPGADAACNEFVHERSGAGRFWSRETRPYDPSAYDVYTICVLHRRGLEVAVLDSGSARLGNTLCGEYVHAGWRER